MSERSDNWSLEEAPLQHHTCRRCDQVFGLAGGVIHDEDGATLAQYEADLSPVEGVRQVLIFMRFKGKRGRKPADLVVTLALRMGGGRVVTSVVTDMANPLGRAMTRKQALASPFLPLVYEIADFIVENDPHVRPYLEEGRTTEDQGGA
jgi:hypothetical protein